MNTLQRLNDPIVLRVRRILLWSIDPNTDKEKIRNALPIVDRFSWVIDHGEKRYRSVGAEDPDDVKEGLTRWPAFPYKYVLVSSDPDEVMRIAHAFEKTDWNLYNTLRRIVDANLIH